MSVPVSADQWVWLARIRRPQGRKGEVLADILTDFPERFAERRRLWLLPPSANATDGQARPVSAPPREVELVHHWLHKGSIVLHFAGVDSISAAETLTGQIVAIPREERAPIAEGEFYISDLIGCTLVDVATAEAVTVGAIMNVERDAGPVPLLIVQTETGESLIPFAKNYLRAVNLAGRRVEMALPEGLTELNS